ncbi:MAG: YkgJ family cysteine cluster protein [Leptospiraceae bacterium]|nr:YkgJ family cysteine cluster protein [Leptospiraceae bacterium]MCP5493371.1 YkgJ family cysteine cluster protein [Leptospiraceae bacterium]
MNKKTKGDTPLVFPKFKNEQNMTTSEICCACTGCCRYVSIQINPPKKKADIDHYTFYLLHKNVQIYIDNDNEWNLLFITPCTQLDGETGFCKIYSTRPRICKDYSPESCSRVGKDHKHLFQTPNSMLRYLKKRKNVL